MATRFNLFCDVINAPLEAMSSVIDSSGYPENRLKIVVNQFNAGVCLSSRSESLLVGIDSFSSTMILQERFIKRSLLDHLRMFHDGGCFCLRLIKYFLTAAAKLETNTQIVAKIFSLLRKHVVEELLVIGDENVHFTGLQQLSFESCQPLVDLATSVLGSKSLLCPSSCRHSDCVCRQIAVSIVRSFLLSINDEGFMNGGNTLKVLSINSGSLMPSVHDGIVVRLIKGETLDEVEKWLLRNGSNRAVFNGLVFTESFGFIDGGSKSNDSNEEQKMPTIKQNYGVSIHSVKAKHCKQIADVLKSASVDVVFCQKLLDDELVYECARRSILVIDRLGLEDCTFLQTFLGANGAIWPSPLDTTDVAASKLKKQLGQFSKIEVVEVGQQHKRLVRISDSSERASSFRTLIVSSPIEDLLPDLKALCECALSALKLSLISRRFVLIGGGFWQVALANAVYEKVNGSIDVYCRDLNLPRPQISRCLVAFCAAIAQTGIHVDRSLLATLRPELRSSVDAHFLLEYENRTLDLSTEETTNGESHEPISSTRDKVIYDCFLVARSAFDTACSCMLTFLVTDKFIDEKSTRRCIDNAPQLAR